MDDRWNHKYKFTRVIIHLSHMSRDQQLKITFYHSTGSRTLSQEPLTNLIRPVNVLLYTTSFKTYVWLVKYELWNLQVWTSWGHLKLHEPPDMLKRGQSFDLHRFSFVFHDGGSDKLRSKLKHPWHQVKVRGGPLVNVVRYWPPSSRLLVKS
jgi:hypothetical protein